MKKLMQEQNRLWDYQILKELGKGQYGHVFQVRLKKDNKIYALKRINIAGSHEKQKVQAFREIKALKSIQHPNIIEYFDSFLSMDNIYIITEFAERGDLSVEIKNRIRREKKYTEDQLWDIIQFLVTATKHIHEKNIIHRDIKVENIFITNKGEYKLGDLGMSKIVYDNSDMLSTRVGTPIYFAPQIIQHKLYSFPVDIWALGCVFYYMAALEHPFKDATIQTLGYYIIDRQPKPIKGPYSPQLISFIMCFFDRNPQTRQNIHQIYKKLKERKDEKIQNKVSIYDLKQILSLKAHYLSEIRDLKEEWKNDGSPKKPHPLIHGLKRGNESIDSLERKDNPERKNSDNLEKRNLSLILPKAEKSLQKSTEKQYQECHSPLIKSNGFTLSLMSPKKNEAKMSPRVRMGQTSRYKPSENDFSINLHDSTQFRVSEFPKRARARGELK